MISCRYSYLVDNLNSPNLFIHILQFTEECPIHFSVKEWPEDFEEDLRTTALPTADLAADLTTQV